MANCHEPRPLVPPWRRYANDSRSLLPVYWFSFDGAECGGGLPIYWFSAYTGSRCGVRWGLYTGSPIYPIYWFSFDGVECGGGLTIYWFSVYTGSLLTVWSAVGV